jgi:hypothetical protein
MASANFYLVLRKSQRHPYLAAKIHTGLPKLGAGEVCMQLGISVPDALFKRPQLRASVSIPDNVAPPVIDADVQDNIARVLSEQLGIAVHVTAEGEG